MSSQLDEILIALRTGETTLDETCRALSAAVRQNPAGTRLWGMLIESRVTQQQLTPTVGRALIDAMETYEPDKTMWLASNLGAAMGEQSGTPAAKAPHSGEILKAPKSEKNVAANKGPHFQDAEELRAFLWDGPAKHSSDKQPAARPAPPRPMPGVVPALEAPELGTVIKGRYRLDSHLGFGGIGQIFGATDLEAERRGGADSQVTIKLIAVDLTREPQALGALQNAVARTKQLRHPNIVSVFGIEHSENRLFVIMEPLHGSWLGDRIKQVRKVGLPHDTAWPLIDGIAKGLAFAHEQNIVHSDLSPYAVFVTDTGTPKIMGFGLIHALPTSNEAMDLLDTMTLRAYSEAYTADTWAMRATPQPSDDLYPLGVIAHELLTGSHPFNRHSLTTARQKNLAWEPAPQLNRRATKLLARCLSFDRADRPKNATRFINRMQGPALLRFFFGAKAKASAKHS